MSSKFFTTYFKIYNLKMESQRIDLAERVWIELDKKYVGQPEGYSLPLAADMRGKTQMLDMRFDKPLLDSDTIIGVQVNEEDEENRPFEIPDCAFIATAISILVDAAFVVGLGTWINPNLASPSTEFYTSFFEGRRGIDIRANIDKESEAQLKHIYNFTVIAS